MRLSWQWLHPQAASPLPDSDAAPRLRTPPSVSAAAAGAILGNLVEREMISEYDYAMIAAALSDKAYACIPQENRDQLRAAILKNMLITHVMLR